MWRPLLAAFVAWDTVMMLEVWLSRPLSWLLHRALTALGMEPGCEASLRLYYFGASLLAALAAVATLCLVWRQAVASATVWDCAFAWTVAACIFWAIPVRLCVENWKKWRACVETNE
jgi:hypothetical protein